MSFSESEDEDSDKESIISTCNADIILSADEVPLAELCYEIVHEEDTSSSSDEKICLNSLEEASRLDQLISPIPPDDDLKSPVNAFSDCGYSSQGSPLSVHDIEHEFDISKNMNEEFNFLELFPSLA